MRAFAQMLAELDAAPAADARIARLGAYFRSAPAADAAWALYLLTGGKTGVRVPATLLRSAACERAGVAEALFEHSLALVGDVAETLALIVPPAPQLSDAPLHEWMASRVLPLRGLSPVEQRARVQACWDELDIAARHVFHKLVGGGLRIGLSRHQVLGALARAHGLDEAVLAQRYAAREADLAGHAPTAEALAALLHVQADQQDAGRPYPLAALSTWPAAQRPSEERAAPWMPGPLSEWLIEWAYDGQRAQVVKRQGQMCLWSNEGELLNDRVPELHTLQGRLPEGTVLVGMLIVWHPGEDAPDASAWRARLGRAKPSRRVLAESPVVFIASDLIEWHGEDWRHRPLPARRAALEVLCRQVNLADPAAPLRLSERLVVAEWSGLVTLHGDTRAHGASGVVMRPPGALGAAAAGEGGASGWLWPADPWCVHAVLVYAQRGADGRASHFSDFTFAVWDRPPMAVSPDESPAQLVSFAKVPISQAHPLHAALEQVVHETATERIGPVRLVKPTLVVSLGFDGVLSSPRHKCGLVVRQPRVLSLEGAMRIEEADTLASLQAMLRPGSGA